MRRTTQETDAYSDKANDFAKPILRALVAAIVVGIAAAPGRRSGADVAPMSLQ